VISTAFEREASWLDGVRAALAGLLEFFDSEPYLARCLLVESVAAGSRIRERRERYVASITAMIEERWRPPGEAPSHPLDTEGVMASLLGILHTHLVAGDGEPLITLLGPAMGLATAPFLDRQGVAREVQRGEALARELLVRSEKREPSHTVASGAELPDMLLDPRAHRARACLLYLAGHPQASNRQVARAVGITSDSHICTLLARLHRVGLLTRRPSAAGGPNSWSLSSHGRQAAQALCLAA
jgi:hypothetical protein